MKKITVAEFVESREILDMLKAFGVDLVQGYHLDTPRARITRRWFPARREYAFS